MNKRMFQHGSFIFGIGLFVVMIGFAVFTNEQIITTGASTILATRPVDPRDLFRGDYVILRYAIERDSKVVSFIQAGSVVSGENIYVQLGEDEQGVAYVVAVSKEFQGTSGETWLTGKVESNSVRFPSIEQYYVPEGTGKDIEQLRDKVFVEVSTLRGQVRIVQLLDSSLKPLGIQRQNGWVH